MKELLFLLISIPLIFSSCEKEEDNTPSVSPPPPSVTTGYVSNQYGQIYKTTDSGVNWTYEDGLYILSNGNSSFNGISFP